MKNSPQTVVRFYGNPDYALQTIGFKEITFLHPDKLNDPFDPPFSFETDFDEDYETLVAWVAEYHADDYAIFKECLPERNWNKFLIDIKSYFNSLYNTFLFSTCAVSNNDHPKDNLYMWGHYGNGHRGVAIEFNASMLEKSALKAWGDGNESSNDGPLFKINYTGELPKITRESIFQYVIYKSRGENSLEESELYKTVARMARSKHTVWERENEWRLMCKNNEGTKLNIQRLALPDDSITAVYLGCRVDDTLKERFLSETRRNFPNAKRFNAQKADGNFALIFRPCESR